MEGRKKGGKTRKVGVYKDVRKNVESGYTGRLIGAHHDDNLGSVTSQEEEDKEVSVIKKKDKGNASRVYGDLLIQYLWKCQTNTIISICITCTDAKSYISKPLQSVLAAEGKEKK
eukprot:6953890-Ditylum_brightwellii.AAC.1